MAPKRSDKFKGATGSSATAPKQLALKRKDTLHLTKRQEAQLQVARKKGSKVRIAKTNLEKVNAGLGNANAVNQDLDMLFIKEYLEEKKYLIAHVASLMRNGLIQKGFQEEDGECRHVGAADGGRWGLEIPGPPRRSVHCCFGQDFRS